MESTVMAIAAKHTEFDPITMTKTVYTDEGDGDMLITTDTDVTAVIEANKARAASIDERARYGELSMVASVPLSIWYKEVVMTGMDKDEPAVKRYLNDRDRRLFRTRPGVI